MPRHGCDDLVDTSGHGSPGDWHCHGTRYYQHAGDYRQAHPERLPPKRRLCTTALRRLTQAELDEARTAEQRAFLVDDGLVLLNWHCHGDDVYHQHTLEKGRSIGGHRH